MKDQIDIHYLYEFCLDWQMNYLDHEEMKKDFIRYGWDFDEFYLAAKKQGWWVGSMWELS